MILIAGKSRAVDRCVLSVQNLAFLRGGVHLHLPVVAARPGHKLLRHPGHPAVVGEAVDDPWGDNFLDGLNTHCTSSDRVAA